MQQQLDQRQQQTLSPRMLQSMKVLQMGIQELREYVEEVLQENPVLELPEPGGEPQDAQQLVRRLEWLEANDRQNLYYHAQDAHDEAGDALARVGCYLDEENSLARYVLSQFFGTELEPEVLRTVEFLVQRLDPSGYLDEEPRDLARAAGVDERCMDRAITELQAADPAGVGARDFAQCLCLQIQRRAGDHRLAIRIVENHLDALAHRRYGLLSRELHASEEEVRAECRLIRTLNPRPGACFSARENLSYITPDLVVTTSAGHFELSVNESALPQLRLSPYYTSLLRETREPEVLDYLTAKSRQAQEVIQAIHQRRATLLQCAQWIVEQQGEFFRLGSGHLVGLTMAQAARALGVHESTVSRAVRDKYLQCERGIYPLSWFFSRPLGEKTVSPEAAKDLLRRLVEAEGDPLSDQRLCEEMGRQGCPISRRTVAKYRAELGIPSASGRR